MWVFFVSAAGFARMFPCHVAGCLGIARISDVFTDLRFGAHLFCARALIYIYIYIYICIYIYMFRGAQTLTPGGDILYPGTNTIVPRRRYIGNIVALGFM